MEYTLLRIPVVCPECGAELLAELPVIQWNYNVRTPRGAARC
jgi:hypothetical protein